MADTCTPTPAMGKPPAFNVEASFARLPVFSTATAMQELWEKACSGLSAKELDWFAEGAARQVCNEARALGAVLERVASLVSSHAGFHLEGDSSDLFFNLHNQLSTIQGLAEIAAEATGRRVRLALKGGAA